MNRTIFYLKRLNITAVILVQVLFFPLTTLAQTTDTGSDVPPVETTQSTEAAPEQPPAAPEQTPTAPSTHEQQAQPGPTEPTGPAPYTQNPETGMWENEYYIWDPATGQTQPKQQQEYSYNPATGKWDTTEWYYSPEQGKYLPNTISTSINPYVLSAPADNSITNTGPDSNNQIENGDSTSGTFDLFFDATISNKIGQLSQSGDATVQGNTLGGNAITGDATAVANLLNMIQSSWGGLGSQDIATFIANINGDVTGDLYVDPNALASGGSNTDIDVTVASNAAIDNDIDVTVASGDANVSGNTTAGSALSGDARAVVNLLNLINTAITSNKSFVGVLNINGNLNGDILLPPEMLKAIIAATGPTSNNQITNGNTVNVDLNADTNTTINNAITTDVGTGNATVSGNTIAGNATSGNASSNVVLLNLTGQKVVAKNAMLVFVNVLGNWVGLIMDAPVGTNAVAITGPNSNNTIENDGSLAVAVDSTRNNLINNDVNVSAHSGDATVSHNTTGGDAKTGDASVGVNVLNMVDSEFNVDDWFGVLFINVFGEWFGSFGVNTEAGNAPAQVGVLPTMNEPTNQGAATSSVATHQTFRFVPRESSGVNQQADQGAVAGVTDQSAPPTIPQTSSAATASSAANSVGPTTTSGNMLWIAGIATFSGVLLLGGERVVSLLRFRRVA